MGKYDELDAAIIGAISNGYKQFAGIHVMAGGAAVWLCTGTIPAWRIVARRLQALRKAGKIRYSRLNGWVLASEKK